MNVGGHSHHVLLHLHGIFGPSFHAGGQGSLILTLSNEAGYQRGKPGLIIRVYLQGQPPEVSTD